MAGKELNGKIATVEKYGSLMGQLIVTLSGGNYQVLISCDKTTLADIMESVTGNAKYVGDDIITEARKALKNADVTIAIRK
jgi:hypothetical protein